MDIYVVYAFTENKAVDETELDFILECTFSAMIGIVNAGIKLTECQICPAVFKWTNWENEQTAAIHNRSEH